MAMVLVVVVLVSQMVVELEEVSWPGCAHACRTFAGGGSRSIGDGLVEKVALVWSSLWHFPL